MANMNVSYDEIESAANQLITGKGQLEDQLMQLRTFISTLVSSGFVTDQASGAFNETYGNFDTAAKSTISNLDILAQNLRQTAQILKDTDTQIASQLRS
ncbi:WXG100 family type VII secretion target [Cellulomonas denverensis]|uniref:WXG100 family type VII secretion target n=1 Tax=Cellulomonas denverensis TaxID=264297 RepID=A0A7X6KUM3_9CELL|nr:WXG100 family type VII secretion target [Cellulomonas denverensis]NKY22303.1 WXG100 family type VII secretion target [Cellulomonas denverensis]GIG25868.1 hypothetical protein Cde04nite_21120 [Cellulomonas denverensis]